MGTCSRDCSALVFATRRPSARAWLVLTLLLTPSLAAAQGMPAAQAYPAALPFRPEPPVRSYVAIRRLESTNERHHKDAWLVARTELRPDGTFAYQVLDEGGSEMIRKRVLHEALKKEAQVHGDGRAKRGGITHENYEFAPPTSSGNEVKVGLVPRKREDMLVKGVMVTSPDGELLRVEGELVKRPSFWTKSVHVVRQYGRVNGTHVPVRFDSRAQVRLVGPSTLSMTFEYLEINGEPVQEANGRSPGAVTRAVSHSRAPSR